MKKGYTHGAIGGKKRRHRRNTKAHDASGHRRPDTVKWHAEQIRLLGKTFEHK